MQGKQLSFIINTLPRMNQTLDFQNINIPFATAQKNRLLLDRSAEKLLKDTEKLRIYTDKDNITIISNGIKDRFYIDSSTQEVNSLGNFTLKANKYTKEDTNPLLISTSSVINLKEAATLMTDLNFMPKAHVFSRIINLNDVKYSNMLGKDEFIEDLMPRSEEVHLMDVLVGEETNIKDTSIISYEYAKEFLVHKTISVDSISVSGDTISNIISSSLYTEDAVFKSEYNPSLDTDLVSLEEMSDNLYTTEIVAISPITVDVVLSAGTPINKNRLLEISSGYVSRIDKKAKKITIGDTREEAEDGHVLSNNETRNIMDTFFTQATDSTINSLSEFYGYLRELCDTGPGMLPKDFILEGKKAYIGFDYGNMYSVLNTSAIQDILFVKKGEYEKGVDGITLYSASYFKDQEEINKLSAYAQMLNFEIDISKQKLATTFDEIRKVVAKLCIMTPDIIPPDSNPPIFPVPDVSNLSIIPPLFISIFSPVMFPMIVVPLYQDIKEFKPFYIFEPTFTQYFNTAEIPYIFPPYYYEMVKTMNVSPPLFDTRTDRITPKILSAPKFQPLLDSCNYRAISGATETMAIFSAEDNCRVRYIGTSNRTLNMMDAAAILHNLNITESSYSMRDGYIISIPETIASMIYNIMVCMSSTAEIPLNIDLCKAIVEIPKEDSRPVSLFCGQELGDPPPAELPPGVYFSLDGVIISEDGSFLGSGNIVQTEWFNPISVEMPSFEEIDGEMIANISNGAASTMGIELKSYVDPVRFANRNSNEPIPGSIGGFEPVVAGSHENRVYMLDYAVIESAEDADEGYNSTGSADPMGIFAGSSMPIVPIGEVIKGNIAMSLDGLLPGSTVLVYSPSSSADLTYIGSMLGYSTKAYGNDFFVPDDTLLIAVPPVAVGQTNIPLIYDTKPGYSVSSGTVPVENPDGTTRESPGIFVGSKFIMYSREELDVNIVLSGSDFLQPDCTAKELPDLPIGPTPPFPPPPIVPSPPPLGPGEVLLINLVGPESVNACNTTEGYSVEISKTLSQDIHIGLAFPKNAPGVKGFGSGESNEFETTILAGEFKSNPTTIAALCEQEDCVGSVDVGISAVNFHTDPEPKHMFIQKNMHTAIIDESEDCSGSSDDLVFINLDGPATVEEGHDTEEYYVEISEPSTAQILITLLMVDKTTEFSDTQGFKDSILHDRYRKIVTIPIGETRSTTAIIETENDVIDDNMEIFEVNIETLDFGGSPTPPLMFTNRKKETAIIENNLMEGACMVEITGPADPEMNTSQDFLIKISSPHTEDLEVELTVTNPSGTTSPTHVTIEAGETQKIFPVIVGGLANGVDNGDFSVEISNSEVFDAYCDGMWGDISGGQNVGFFGSVRRGGEEEEEEHPEVIMSVGSTALGCDDNEDSSESSTISPSIFSNISDLSSVPTNGTQEEGDVPGAVIVSISLTATKIEKYEASEDADPEYVRYDGMVIQKIGQATVCLVLGCIDGKEDDKGDVLAQGYSAGDIPEGDEITYIGPTITQRSQVRYARDDVHKFSTFTLPLSSIIANITDTTTSSPFPSGMSAETVDSPGTITGLAKKEVVKIGNIATSGMMFYYKHAGKDPKWPIVGGYGGSSSLSLTTGTKIVGSSGGPLPTVIHTHEDTADSYLPSVASSPNTSFMYINKDSVTWVLKDVPAPLSEKRIIQFRYEYEY